MVNGARQKKRKTSLAANYYKMHITPQIFRFWPDKISGLGLFQGLPYLPV
jgi:hypothetical protein